MKELQKAIERQTGEFCNVAVVKNDEHINIIIKSEDPNSQIKLVITAENGKPLVNVQHKNNNNSQILCFTRRYKNGTPKLLGSSQIKDDTFLEFHNIT